MSILSLAVISNKQVYDYCIEHMTPVNIKDLGLIEWKGSNFFCDDEGVVILKKDDSEFRKYSAGIDLDSRRTEIGDFVIYKFPGLVEWFTKLSYDSELDPGVEGKIYNLVESNPGQGTLKEYRHLWSTIAEKGPCNVLVFGVGKDSALWVEANKGGRTVFIEHEPEWILETQSRLPQAEVIQVRYSTVGLWWKLYTFFPGMLELQLPKEIRNTKWDIIFVDSPQGYSPYMYSRVMSIYTASLLAKENQNGTEVLVHDCDRAIEYNYSEWYLGENGLEFAVDKLRHYKV